MWKRRATGRPEVAGMIRRIFTGVSTAVVLTLGTGAGVLAADPSAAKNPCAAKAGNPRAAESRSVAEAGNPCAAKNPCVATMPSECFGQRWGESCAPRTRSEDTKFGRTGN